MVNDYEVACDACDWKGEIDWKFRCGTDKASGKEIIDNLLLVLYCPECHKALILMTGLSIPLT